MPRDQLFFIFDGVVVTDNLTPHDLDMEDGDSFDVETVPPTDIEL